MKQFNPNKIFRKIALDPYAERVFPATRILDMPNGLRSGECVVSTRNFSSVSEPEKKVHFSSFSGAVEFLRRHGQKGIIDGSRFGYIVCMVEKKAYSVRVECITHERAEEIKASMCLTGKKYFKKIKKRENFRGRKVMLYELLFGYETRSDEWTKAEGNDIRDIAIEFFRFIERTNIEKQED